MNTTSRLRLTKSVWQKAEIRLRPDDWQKTRVKSGTSGENAGFRHPANGRISTNWRGLDNHDTWTIGQKTPLKFLSPILQQNIILRLLILVAVIAAAAVSSAEELSQDSMVLLSYQDRTPAEDPDSIEE
jgi:hypothetical protein